MGNLFTCNKCGSSQWSEEYCQNCGSYDTLEKWYPFKFIKWVFQSLEVTEHYNGAEYYYRLNDAESDTYSFEDLYDYWENKVNNG